jgi:hypothetical protein
MVVWTCLPGHGAVATMMAAIVQSPFHVMVVCLGVEKLQNIDVYDVY